MRRPDIMWGMVAACSFVTPLLIVMLKSHLFVEEPTLQQDAQSVAVRRGPSGRRSSARAHGKYAMAVETEMESAEIIE